MASAFAKVAALCAVALLLQSTGLLVFVLGFFPVKPALNGISGTQSFAPGCDVEGVVQADLGLHNSQKRPPSRVIDAVPAQYDRLVFMVIDGLPAEFVLGKASETRASALMAAMPFTQSLLFTGSAVAYHAKAASPTVTMPRLKAMTSGAIAGFLDVAYNFNTQALLEDNWIAQVARAGWRMVMLGDNTWLKLFPNLFERHDGVHSFFVKDIVEVDRNVTRHLDAELTSNEWDLLVLHYLGLDHVGHLGGRSSSLMPLKLKEMDDVIMRIHQVLLGESGSSGRTLMVVASDHGMTDSGNHGGATSQEIDALALFVYGSGNNSAPLSAEGFKAWEAFQVDLVPTIAMLVGVPIPKNSVGALLPHLFASLTPEQQLKALERNSWQLWRLVHARSPGSTCVNQLCRADRADEREYFPSAFQSNDRLQTFCSSFESARKLHQKWKHQRVLPPASDDLVFPTFEIVQEAYLHFLKPASEWLARGSTEKRANFLLSGSCMMLVSAVLFMLGLHKTCELIAKESGQVFTQTTPLCVKMVAIGGVCAHAATLGSSSLVEEEQYTYHFLVSTLFVVFSRLSLQSWGGNKQDWSTKPSTVTSNNRSMKLSTVTSNNSVRQVLAIGCLLLLGRALRSWHRSGVNWTHLPDVAKFLESGSPSLVNVIRIICVCTVTLLCCKMTSKSLPIVLRYVVAMGLTLSAGLIFMYIRFTSTRFTSTAVNSVWATLTARLVFGVLGATCAMAVFVIPWTVAISTEETTPSSEALVSRKSSPQQIRLSTSDVVLRGTVDATGLVLVSCWCLLQLMLQQPVNAGPVLLLLLQLMMTLTFFRRVGPPYQPWVPILTLHWLGASGHFGLGNSNTVATVDVAGAYIGLASHSTILSGILAFCITYGSPLLYMQAVLLSKSSRSGALEGRQSSWLLESVALPVVLPLALNCVVLIVFTGVLLIMQDHLFVWSVFSPKYLYVCMNTFAIYVGTLMVLVVGAYSRAVLSRRMRWEDAVLKGSKRD